MFKSIKQFAFIVSVLAFCVIKAHGFSLKSSHFSFQKFQIDSLIKEKSINNDMTQLELLVLYHNAWKQNHADSINIFRNLALLNAELEQPEDALLFTNKYIQNTLDIGIVKDPSYNALKGTDEYNVIANKYMVQIGPLSFLYFCIALIGFYFMVVINFLKNSNRSAKLFMGCFIGAHSLFILEFVLFVTNLQQYVPHSYRISSTVSLLFGPLLFLYFKSVVDTHKFRLIDNLHFLPALVFIVASVGVYSLNAQEKLKLILNINPLNRTFDIIIFFTKILSLGIYAYLIKNILFSKRNRQSKNEDETWKWKKNIFGLHVAYLISYTIYGASIFKLLGSWSVVLYHIQMIIMSITVMYIAHMAYVQPSIFKKRINGLLEKYQKSGLTNSLSEELKQNLIDLFLDDKVYKENNISLETLSRKLNTTRHNTSQIINEHFNMNFFELINKFRIKEAVDMFNDDIHGSLNIIDVAYEVGYNNKVTFNKAFKKEMSVTPSEYIQSQIS